MRRILAISSIRSDYDLMSELFKKLNLDPEIDFGILVSGAHLSKTYGYSVDLIRKDKLRIIGEVESLIDGDSKSSRLKTASGFLSGSIDLIKVFDPDILIYAGDREDVLIASIIGGFLGIPTAHFFGGDHAADGHIDNPVRHAVSKLSTTHFVSIEQHKKRLQSIGEIASRIFVIGSIALDKFYSEEYISKEKLIEILGANEHAIEHPLAVMIFHPMEHEMNLVENYVKNAVNALIEAGFHVFISYPNTDPGSQKIIGVIAELQTRPELTVYKNLDRNTFVNLLRLSKILIGNSSTGILEAATLKLPVANIGDRQRGRLADENVLFIDGDLNSIRNAVDLIVTNEFQSKVSLVTNLYGNGDSSELAVDILKTFDFASFVAKVEDPINVQDS